VISRILRAKTKKILLTVRICSVGRDRRMVEIKHFNSCYKKIKTMDLDELKNKLLKQEICRLCLGQKNDFAGIEFEESRQKAESLLRKFNFIEVTESFLTQTKVEST
jgi:hypothetical protein